MNRIIAVCTLFVFAGCHTTDAYAVRSPKAETAPGASCMQQCNTLKARDPDDTEAFLRCLAVCPETTVNPGECSEQIVSAESKCADQAVRKVAVGRTIWLIIGIAAGAFVAGEAALIAGAQ